MGAFGYSMSTTRFYGYCSKEITPLLLNTVYGIEQTVHKPLLASTSGLSFAWGRCFFWHESP